MMNFSSLLRSNSGRLLASGTIMATQMLLSRCGFTIPCYDALVAAIEKILADSDLENKLRNAVENHLIAHHPDVVSRRYLEVIETATN